MSLDSRWILSPNIFYLLLGFPGGSGGKESACNAGNPGSIPGTERSPGEGHDNLLWYSYPEKTMGKGAWLVTVHGISKSRT